MRKKMIYSILAVFLIVAVLFFLFSKKKSSVKEEKLNVSLPAITGAVNVKAEYLFNLPKDLSLPTTAPLISQEVSLDWSLDDIKKIASNFDFSKKPIVFNDTILGKTYLYTEGPVSLTLYPSAKIVRFSEHVQPSQKKGLTDEDYVEIAKSFVNKISLKNIYELSFINYLNTGYSSERYSFSDKESSNTVQVNLSPVAENIKIITKSPDTSLATVTMDKAGNITKTEIRNLDKLIYSEQKYKLKDLEQIKNSTAGFILMSLDNGYYPDLNQIKDDITNVNITSIELAYFYNYEEKTYIQAVFLIRGTAKMKNVQKEVNVSFYYPAFVQ